MKPFSFRLDHVLRYRDYLEKKAQRDLSHAMNACIEREKEINRLAFKRAEIAKTCGDEALRGIDVHRYQSYRSFLRKIDHDLEAAHLRLKKGQEKVRVKNSALKKASIKKKTLETLKEMQFKEHKKETEIEEQKVTDELVILRRGGSV